MKKLILSGAALLLATVSFAQNVVITTQNGTSQTATATQSGSSLTATVSQNGTPVNNKKNLGFTIQSGTGHTATVNQDGGSTSNRAGAYQENTTGLGSNSATISQSNGSGGSTARSRNPNVSLASDGNWAGTNQVGSGNKATIMQDGANTRVNFAETWQKGSGNTATTTQNAGFNNRAEIFQGDDTRSGTPSIPPSLGVNVAVSGNTATVDQSNSSTNDAFTRQFSNTNTATVTQTGAGTTNNKASVQQGDGMNPAGQAGNTATVDQTGGSSNTAVSEQTGKSGSATINQIAGAATNTAFIKQVSGTGSGAAINQTTYAGATSMNDARITQYGDGQVGVTTQDFAKSSSIVIMQGGNGIMSGNNRADVRQVNGVTSSTATIMQNTTADGGQNKARIEQIGVTQLNMGTISQQGSSNEAGLIQTGAGSNTATISQTGNFNMVGGPGTVDPGNSTLTNNSYAKQDGSANGMVVNQTSTAVTATASFNNAAVLSQTGTGNTMTVDQVLTSGTSGNLATVTQNGSTNTAVVQQNGTLLP